MNYYGKKYLYNFLNERYDITEILKDYGIKPKMKDFNYQFYRGDEWLKSFAEEIEIYSPCRGVIYVTLSEIDDETGDKHQIEYSKYVDGVLNYQKKCGEILVIRGKPYKRLTAS